MPDSLTLDVVSFAVPYPPVYGGVIDVYYRLRALKALGVRIRLHSFTYEDSRPAPELEQLCDSVHYYERSKSVGALWYRTPFIQVTRFSDELIDRLSAGSGPILYEGLHTSGRISHDALVNRPAFIRMHNVEWHYYRGLAGSESPGLWKMYYALESRKLRRYEREAVSHARKVFAISQREAEYFGRMHPDVVFIAPFHPYDAIDMLLGRGDYVLYQGDLSIADNARSALKIAAICESSQIPLVVAGRAPSSRTLAKFSRFQNTTMHLDVSQEKMEELMRQAQIHVIESSVTAGFKLKLIASLFTARNIVARRSLVDKGLEKVVYTYQSIDELPDLLKRLDAYAITEEDVETRKEVVLPRFSNMGNARRLIKEIFDHEIER